jgi:hypothetical protein
MRNEDTRAAASALMACPTRDDAQAWCSAWAAALEVWGEVGEMFPTKETVRLACGRWLEPIADAERAELAEQALTRVWESHTLYELGERTVQDAIHAMLAEAKLIRTRGRNKGIHYDIALAMVRHITYKLTRGLSEPSFPEDREGPFPQHQYW